MADILSQEEIDILLEVEDESNDKLKPYLQYHLTQSINVAHFLTNQINVNYTDFDDLDKNCLNDLIKITFHTISNNISAKHSIFINKNVFENKNKFGLFNNNISLQNNTIEYNYLKLLNQTDKLNFIIEEIITPLINSMKIHFCIYDSYMDKTSEILSNIKIVLDKNYAITEDEIEIIKYQLENEDALSYRISNEKEEYMFIFDEQICHYLNEVSKTLALKLKKSLESTKEFKLLNNKINYLQNKVRILEEIDTNI